MNDFGYVLEAYAAANDLYYLYERLGLPLFSIGESRQAAFDLLSEYGTVVLDEYQYVSHFIPVSCRDR